MFCRERAARFSAIRDELVEAGVSLSFIGNGTPAMAQAFREDFDVRGALYTDPARTSYQALGLKRSFGLMKSLARGRRALAGGFRQGKPGGDVWQQGGVILFDPSGVVRWKHVDDGAGHQTDLNALRRGIAAL